jgi:hypothetical protein
VITLVRALRWLLWLFALAVLLVLAPGLAVLFVCLSILLAVSSGRR